MAHSNFSRQQIFVVGLIAAITIGGWQFYRWWNRPVAVEFDNLKYVQLLTTAVSARNSEWVDRVESTIIQRFETKQMSKSELAHFQKIIQNARKGNWEQGDRDCFEFAQAQLNRRRSQPPQQEHDGHQH